MSFYEFLRAIEDHKSIDFLAQYQPLQEIPEIVHGHLWQQLKRYFVVGGLPEVVKTYAEFQDNLYEALNRVRAKQEQLLLAYLADMAKHAGKENAMHIERLWHTVPAQLARHQSGSANKFVFKDVVPGIKSYSRLVGSLDWLQTAGLIIKVHIIASGYLPFKAYMKENAFKLYLFDVGMLGALSQLSPKTILDYEYGSYKGYFAENFVAQELIAAGIKSLYSWHEATAEVEFVQEYEGQVFPIEVKSGWVTKSKSLKVFSEKYHPPYRIVMSAKNLTIDNEHKLHCYPLYLACRFPYKLFSSL